MKNAYADFYQPNLRLTHKIPDKTPSIKYPHRFYAGLGPGYDMYTVKENFTIYTPSVSQDQNRTLRPLGFLGSIFAGYGYFFTKDFYLAGEAFVNNTSAIITDNVTSAGVLTTEQFMVGTSFGLSLLPGLRLSKYSLFYFRGGYIQARVKAKNSVSIYPIVINDSKPAWINGINLGVGLETAINNTVSVRAEYNYANYATFRFGLSKFSVRDGQIILALVFQMTREHL